MIYLENPRIWRLFIWLVVWNINFMTIFSHILGMSSSQSDEPNDFSEG